MEIIWNDAAVQAAVIQAIGSITATAIAAVVAAIVGKRFADQKRLQEKNGILQNDLFFLLAVEEEHCKQHGQKIVIRERVRKEGHRWSGKFTPGRVKAYGGALPPHAS